jgi:hypothetical protein
MPWRHDQQGAIFQICRRTGIPRYQYEEKKPHAHAHAHARAPLQERSRNNQAKMSREAFGEVQKKLVDTH